MGDFTLSAQVADMGAPGHFVRLSITDAETGEGLSVILTPAESDHLSIALQDLAGDAINADRSERRG